MNNKTMIEQMAKDTGLSIEEATKALNGLKGKMQVTRVIKSLKKKKLIIVKAQKNKNGGQYFNRYEINFKEVNNLVTKCDMGSNKMVHTKDNNTKEKNRERIIPLQKMYFFLYHQIDKIIF